MVFTKGHKGFRTKESYRLQMEEYPIWNIGRTKKEFPQLGNSGVKKGNIPWNKNKKYKCPNRKTGKYVMCFTCGNLIYKQICQLKERNYCSKFCVNTSPYKRKESSDRMKLNNPLWIKGVKEKIKIKKIEYYKTHKPYNYIDGSSKNRKYVQEEWKIVAKKVYKRDDYQCQICGKKYCQLNAHHILPWAGYPKLIYKLNNIITLCVPCHTKVHKGVLCV